MYWIKQYEVKCPECGHIYVVDCKEFTDGITFVDFQKSTTDCPKCTCRHTIHSSKTWSSKAALTIILALFILILTMVAYLLYLMYFRPW
jgi:uncharacterized paraquat-inducible protein A